MRPPPCLEYYLEMIAPSAASSRPVIRVVHPSGALEQHLTALEAGLAALESAGCEVRWDPNRANSSWRGYLAGDDQTRAKELCDALIEPDVEIVWAARGGSGANRIIEPVLESAKSIRPRILLGFSDITTILNAFAVRLNWITFHGPVVTSIGRDSQSTDLEEILGVLQGGVSQVGFQRDPDGEPAIEGRLLGGNLTVLSTMVGSHLGKGSGTGAIWLLEDVGESPYRLDRSFWQLKQSGAMDGSVGLWMGDFDLGESETERVAQRMAADSSLSVITGAPAGHRGALAVLPIGAAVRLEATRGRVTALQPWVEHNGA